MRYAGLKALILIIIGIIFSQYINLPNIYLLIFIILSIACSFFTKGYSLYFALFLVSALNYNSYETNQKILKNFPLYDKILQIKAQVIEEPITESNRYSAKLISANNYRLSAKVFLNTKTAKNKFNYGDNIEIYAKISDFDYPRNPNLIDYNDYFHKQGFVGNIFTTGSEIKLIKQKQGNWFIQNLIYPLRRNFFQTIDKLFEGNEKNLLLGILLGETRGMSKTMRTTFSDAGVAHILAVSGLNVAILIGVLLLLLPILRIRGSTQLIIIILITLLYLCIVGFKASAFRAGLMAILASLGIFLQRREDILNGVFVAAIIILFISPQALTDIGFLLSFSAVTAIILIVPKIYKVFKEKKIVKFIRLYIILPCIVSFTAFVGTAPINLYYFFRLPVLTIIANLFIVPIVGIATPLGFLVVLANFFWHQLAVILSNTLWLCLRLIILISTKFSSLSFAVIEPGRPSAMLIILFYLAVPLMLFWEKIKFRKLTLATILVGINIFVWQNALRSKSLSITFLDIKQGDAIFFDLPNGRKMLLDAGEENEIVSQFLKSKGIKNIDLAIITHPHLDHYGGFINLLNGIKIKNVIIATDQSKDTMYTNLIHCIKNKETKIYYADQGQIINGLGIKAEVLSPNASIRRIYNLDALKINDLSIVLKLKYYNTTLLLPGDLDNVEFISDQGLRADILKSPHHGSKKANSQILYSLVHPQFLIISGRRNINQSTNDLIRVNKIRTFNLRKDGGLKVEVKQKNQL